MVYCSVNKVMVCTLFVIMYLYISNVWEQDTQHVEQSLNATFSFQLFLPKCSKEGRVEFQIINKSLPGAAVITYEVRKTLSQNSSD